MGEKWVAATDVRPRDWQERIEDTEELESDITIMLTDRLEAILNLRDVQDLSSYAV